MNSKNYNSFTCYAHPLGFLYIEFKTDLRVDLDIAREIVRNRLEFTNHRSHYIMIDFSNVKEVTHDAKEYMQHPEGGLKNILGAVFIAGNLPAELMAKIYVKTVTGFPTKFCYEKEEAFTWMVGLMKRK